jgi:hypothetical protein
MTQSHSGRGQGEGDENKKYNQPVITPTLPLPEGVNKLNFSRHPGENRGQEIGKPLKTLDSGFRRNDGEKTQIDFFTTSPVEVEGVPIGTDQEICLSDRASCPILVLVSY